MERYKYKCKKNFNKFISSTIFIFKKDEWYLGYRDDDIMVIAHSHEHYINTPHWRFDEDDFRKKFYTVDEVREMEINKILN